MIFTTQTGLAQQDDLITWYETHDCEETPRLKETIDYCKRLDAACPAIRYTTFGTTPQGCDLGLLIVDKQQRFEPAAVKASGNVVLLIQACIHAGESDGKDAGLMLLRDIATDEKHAGLLDHVTILFMPVFNADGHERFGPYGRINQNGPKSMGWRTTARNLNLNRDFVKADAPEMRAWLRAFNRWSPDFLVDCHTTDGADFQYPLTYILELKGNMDRGLTVWTRDVYLPAVEKGMQQAGHPIFPYVAFRKWHDPRSGLRSGVSAAMFSSGYAAVRNRPGLLIETHMLKDYKTRVEATYYMLYETLAVLSREHRRFTSLVDEADREAAGREFRRRELPVAYTLSSKSVPVEFDGVEYEVVKSDLTGGDWARYGEKPETFTVPYFNQPIVTCSAKLPEAYVVPVEWTEIIELLDLHGIRYTRLERETPLSVASTKFRDVIFASEPYEGRTRVENLEWDDIREERAFPAGSAVIPLDQPAARLIGYMFEPGCRDSFLRWGFFNTILERTEYFESYVMERVAREMLAEDDALRKQYERKKAEDEAFAADPSAQLAWFYRKTPYYDDRHNVYPVGKITRREVVEELHQP